MSGRTHAKSAGQTVRPAVLLDELCEVKRTAEMLKKDLAAARVAWIAESPNAWERQRREHSSFLKYQNDQGQFADFHALRCLASAESGRPWYELAQPVRRFHVDNTQDSKRRHFSPHEKVAAVKRHLLERVPISAICEELKIAPNMFYRWQQELFENAHLSFETDRKSKAIDATKDRKIEQLEGKLQRKNEVLAELMEEHVQLKKELGEP